MVTKVPPQTPFLENLRPPAGCPCAEERGTPSSSHRDTRPTGLGLLPYAHSTLLTTPRALALIQPRGGVTISVGQSGVTRFSPQQLRADPDPDSVCLGYRHHSGKTPSSSDLGRMSMCIFSAKSPGWGTLML